MTYAITGGIGSGKSYVARLLRERGIEVYDCDRAAKRLMRSSRELQEKLSSLVGRDIFPGGQLDKAALATFLLASPENNRRVNEIVHPAVAADFQQSGLRWMESAILFEAGFERYVDRVVCVTAPLETRLRRVMLRDNISREKALAWAERQLPQEEKERRSDFRITNDGLTPLPPQIDTLLACSNKALSQIPLISQI